MNLHPVWDHFRLRLVQIWTQNHVKNTWICDQFSNCINMVQKMDAISDERQVFLDYFRLVQNPKQIKKQNLILQPVLDQSKSCPKLDSISLGLSTICKLAFFTASKMPDSVHFRTKTCVLFFELVQQRWEKTQDLCGSA